jgi:hypothetical protein
MLLFRQGLLGALGLIVAAGCGRTGVDKTSSVASADPTCRSGDAVSIRIRLSISLHTGNRRWVLGPTTIS